MPRPAGPSPPQTPGVTWESFGASALWRLVGLLALLVLAMGVLTWSWEVALATARLALVVLLAISTWLYVLWFRRQRAALSAREDRAADQLRDYRPT